MTRPTPPLWTWAAALALAGAVMAALVLDPAGSITLEGELNLARLDAPNLAERPLVVVMGRSKVRCAVEFDDRMEARLGAQGVSARVVRIVMGGGVLDDFRPLLERFEREPPRLLLVEEDVLMFRQEEPGFRAPRSPIENARRAVRTHLGMNQVRVNHRDQGGEIPCQVNRYATDGTTRDAYSQAVADWPHVTMNERDEWFTRLDEIRQQGATVAFIQTPRSAVATQSFPAEADAHVRAMVAIATSHEFARLTPPQPPQSDYADLAYLNAAGRDSYSAWLAAEIAKAMEAHVD